ncbi:hypothetical protein [Rhodococcus sp. WB9]|uniref:hypothetical protein n=1 Tax=Rhodococcus sp. WB9 TaxID=2594007 RepID=UPI0021B1983B|nr:hypothetical protein [Rhodococcus sp. WB9]
MSQLAVGGDLDELLAAAAGAAAALMGVQCSSIAQMSDDGELAVLAYRGPEPSPTTFAPGRGSQPGYAAASGAVIVCADAGSMTPWTPRRAVARALRCCWSISTTSRSSTTASAMPAATTR